MSFKQEPIVERAISDQEAREFEKELNGQSFEDYARASGWTIQNMYYPKGAIRKSTLPQYEAAKRKYRALENLRERRYYAERIEHKNNLILVNKEVCQEKTLNKDRCVYCYPWTFREWCLANGREDLVSKIDGLNIKNI